MFAIVASAILILSHASTSVVSVEPENGTTSGNLVVNNNTTASNNKSILFGGSTTNLIPTGYGQVNGPSGTWNLKFDDEFDGTSLNTANWNTGWLGSGITSPVQNQELACYDPAQVTVNGGTLNLSAIKKDINCSKGTNPHPYTSGNIESNGKKSFTYGYFEARINIQSNSNGYIYNWPAWWLDGQPTWPSNGELDIMEGLGGANATASATWHGPVDGGNGHNFADKPELSGWHTFAAEWAPGIVTAYYDGVAQRSYSSSTNITSSPQFMILGLQIDGIVSGGITNVPGLMQVDYVRVWQR